MSQVSYGHTTEEGFLSLLDALKQGDWGAIPIPDNPSPQDILALGVVAMCKLQLMSVLLAMRRLLHPRPEDAAEVFDQAWDRVQRAYNADITALENHKDPQTRTDGSTLRAASLKGQGTGQTTMRYEAEVQWGLAQVEKANEESLKAIIDRHNLQARIDEIEATTRALAQAIGWDLASHTRLRRALQKRFALQRCAQVCVSVHNHLQNTLDLLPSLSPEAHNLRSLLAPLQKLQADRPASPAKKTDEDA